MPDRNDAPSKEEVEDLVRRAQQGHSEAFAGLYEAYYDKIYRYVMFKTGDTLEAEDLTEEVFLRMLESIGSFKWQGYPFTSWLFQNRAQPGYRLLPEGWKAEEDLARRRDAGGWIGRRGR